MEGGRDGGRERERERVRQRGREKRKLFNIENKIYNKMVVYSKRI